MVLSYETKQKSIQGGLSNEEANQDKRIYATEKNKCPVTSLKLLTSLSNHCAKEAISDSGKPINQWKSINLPNLCATFTELQNVNKDTQNTA